MGTGCEDAVAAIVSQSQRIDFTKGAKQMSVPGEVVQACCKMEKT